MRDSAPGETRVATQQTGRSQNKPGNNDNRSASPRGDGGQPRGDQSKPAGAVGRRVYSAGSQKVLVLVSPLGLTSNTPDIFIHFHGYYTNYGIDDQTAERDKLAGSDKAAEAMVSAQANLIAILPQGVAGARAPERTKRGG